jgi:hypothetical protein
MKDVIVYSFYLRNESAINNRCYKQLRYSLKTLRDYNKDIPVKVFIGPYEADLVGEDITKFPNVEIIHFNNNYPESLYRPWIKEGYAEFLYHRWQNAFYVLKFNNAKNVLYLDTDTVFHKDPQKLFDLYGNTLSLWGREDNTLHLMEALGMENGLNDGQFILSKEFIPYEKDFMEFTNTYITKTLTWAKKNLLEKDYFQLFWLMVQYAAFEFCKEHNIPVNYFPHNQVMLHIEPDYNDTKDLILHHYYAGNTTKYVPKEFFQGLF